ncbi:sugar phosphate isomerase/epimerase [Flavobacteriaceae bacterium]|jgi:sugar phosphate isomerase/epimerase|nr:sugar phosphate isomerase/epimerase [Flavobacteriaceae bacterium]
MKTILTNFLILLIMTQIGTLKAQNTLHFYQTNWGNTASWDAFCEKAKASGYDGIEVWTPRSEEEQAALKKAIEKHQLRLVLMCGTANQLSKSERIAQYTNDLKTALAWKPDLINSHTGSEFFTVEENLEYIRIAEGLSKTANIPIYHETHRGRFSYSLLNCLEHVAAEDQLRLTLDISHWMVVHESLLEGRDALLEPIIDKTRHIHARIGYQEGPQVNDPNAPEWKAAVDRHLDIWEAIIKARWEAQQPITVTTEFGPPHYMPALPYTQMPVSDQWKANTYMMQRIKERLGLK